MTRNRIYVTVNSKDELKAITLYDKNNKRYKQIDISGPKHIVDGEKILPHTHYGYFHDENGIRNITKHEMALIDRVKKEWYSRRSKR